LSVVENIVEEQLETLFLVFIIAPETDSSTTSQRDLPKMSRDNAKYYQQKIVNLPPPMA
jgi:hypothetical protein